MKKQDLKDGMIIETSNKEMSLVLGDSLRYQKGWYDLLEDFNDSMINYIDKRYSIDKVFTIKNTQCGLEDIFNKNNLKLIWRRDREIDWSKVPSGTKVINSYDIRLLEEGKEDSVSPRYFVEYNKQISVNPFITLDKNGVACCNVYCEIHPDVEVKEEWYK